MEHVAPPADGWRFVVQRHRARRLHYDLRFEAAGVLLSWAVPKGPTLDPDVRRMAVHVDDHPLDYFDFEGVIPAGEYGGGDVIVWDWGTWALARERGVDDPLAAVDAGDLHVDLEGEKLRGRFALVRRGAGRDWLLIKKRDAAAVAGWDPEDHPRSVKTGRTSDEVRDAPAATWSNTAVWAAPTAAELAALVALGRSGTWDLGGHELRLTDLDQVLFPARPPGAPVTKRDLIRHHATAAPAMLPYLAERAVDLHRYPDGVDRPGFSHEGAPDHAPAFLRRWRDEAADPGATQRYVVLDSAAALAWVADVGAVELHPWTSRIDEPQRPTWALIEIDPGPAATFDDVVVLARLHRTALEHLGVDGRPKVTGTRGIEIWIPVARRYTFDQTRAWVEQVSGAIGATMPELVWREREVPERGGRIRLDTTQNAIGRTQVAPFSARAAPGAPVSVPIGWDELDDPELRPDGWTLHDVARRLERDGDPLAPLVGLDQRLPSL